MKKLSLLIVFALLFTFSACKQASVHKPIPDIRTQKYLLKKRFALWQQEAIKARLFWANDSCDLITVGEEGEVSAPDGKAYTKEEWLKDPSHYLPKNTDFNDWGFADASDESYYQYSYTDLNADGRLDQMVFFWPKHCDRFSGASWQTVTVLFVSNEDDFTINTFVSEDDDPYGTGFYMPSKIDSGMIMGSIIGFASGDAMCCPSINKPMVLDYATWKYRFEFRSLEYYMRRKYY